MARFPALPATVDRYVREFLNRLAGRSGNAGDKAVLHSELAELGLAKEKGQRLSLPATTVGSITDTLEPVNPAELPDNPTTPEGLSAAGIMGAIILQWQPASYKGHNHTEVWRAQVDGREQASLVHEANGSRYTDITGNTTACYYWIRHVNSAGQVGGYNQMGGTRASALAGTEHIQDQIRGAVDKSWFTPGWASYTDSQEVLLSDAHNRIDQETTTRQAAITSVQQVIVDGDNVNATNVTNLTATVNQNIASITEQQTVTNGLKAEYTLKVRQEANGQTTVAGIGVASGQAEDGETFSEISFAAESFFFTTPNGTAQPFVITNAGTEAVPDYKMALDADVVINGALNISQLQSGELQNGTALTVGQGSIELSTASDGYGQVVITGSGGIATNDYLVLKQRRIESFIYSQTEGHIRYKEVRRTESGIATNGQQVSIPAYFKSQPTVNLYPRDISVYNANYLNQSQRLEMDHTTPIPHPTIEGAWVFTPYARLLLSDGSATEAHGLSYFGSNNSQRWEMNGVHGLTSVVVYGRGASSRHTGSGNTWQNRKVTMKLEYRSSGGGWINAGSSSVDINQFNTHALQVSKSLAQGNYDIAVTFSAADRSGTFTSGALEYDYTQSNKTGAGWSKTLYAPPGRFEYSKKHTQYISLDSYALSGWEATRIDYRAKVLFTIKARTGYDGNWITNNKKPGEAYIEVPDGKGGVTKYRVYSGTSDSGYYNEDVWNSEDSREVNITWSDSTYKDGNIRGPLKLYTSKSAYTRESFGANGTFGGEPIATAYASATISNITATVYYRKVRPKSSTASNTFYWDSSHYDLGATDISISDAIIHWTATGE